MWRALYIYGGLSGGLVIFMEDWVAASLYLWKIVWRARTTGRLCGGLVLQEDCVAGSYYRKIVWRARTTGRLSGGLVIFIEDCVAGSYDRKIVWRARYI